MENHLVVHSARMLLLGIDPGGPTTHTGLGFIDRTRRCDRLLEDGGGLELYALAPLDAYDLIRQRHAERGIAVAVLEDARGLPVYARHAGVKGAARDRLARDVGGIDANTATLADLLARLSIPTVLRRPAPGSAKWDGERFRLVIGYPGPTNQHQRDAAALVYGYTASALLREAAASPAPTRPSSPEGSPSPATA